MKTFSASVIIAILLISICPLQLKASEHNNTIAPSPAPSSSTVNITSGQSVVGQPTVDTTSDQSVVGQPTVNTTSDQSVVGPPIVKETCKAASKSCQFKTMTACLYSTETGPQSSLLVVNDGESSVKVKITLLPANNTLTDIEIPSHQTKKINISANIGIGSSILFDAGDGNCTIHTGSPAPQFNFYQQFSSYHSYATPTNGAYILIGISIIIGGTWACCQLKKTDRHMDGVPYQELEMGNSNIPLSTNVDDDVEAAEGWDQDWDDDWDEDKAVVKSPGGNHLNGKSTNGISSKSADWGNDWDD